MLSIAKEFVAEQHSFMTPETNENPGIYLNQINNLQQRLQVLENEIGQKKTEVKCGRLDVLPAFPV